MPRSRRQCGWWCRGAHLRFQSRCCKVPLPRRHRLCGLRMCGIHRSCCGASPYRLQRRRRGSFRSILEPVVWFALQRLCRSQAHGHLSSAYRTLQPWFRWPVGVATSFRQGQLNRVLLMLTSRVRPRWRLSLSSKGGGTQARCVGSKPLARRLDADCCLCSLLQDVGTRRLVHLPGGGVAPPGAVQPRGLPSPRDTWLWCCAKRLAARLAEMACFEAS